MPHRHATYATQLAIGVRVLQLGNSAKTMLSPRDSLEEEGEELKFANSRHLWPLPSLWSSLGCTCPAAVRISSTKKLEPLVNFCPLRQHQLPQICLRICAHCSWTRICSLKRSILRSQLLPWDWHLDMCRPTDCLRVRATIATTTRSHQLRRASDT